MPDIIHDAARDTGPDAPAGGDAVARQQAIRQLERKRRFRVSAAWAAVVIVILVAIWAMSEYHNAGGWPTQGFSQSSGIHDVWNFWIVYPVGAIVLLLMAHGWYVYGNKPISEGEIQREMERQAGSGPGEAGK